MDRPRPLVLGSIPKLREDELLYSWVGHLARTRLFGQNCRKLRILTGGRMRTAGVDLPTGLRCLQERLGVVSPFRDVDDLVARTTLYPFHRPFIDEARDVRCREMMAAEGGRGLKLTLGRLANRFGACPLLKLCRVCAQQDLRNDRYAHWRRTHHLPGVNWCPVHAVPLDRIGVATRSSNPFLFEPVPREIPRGRPAAQDGKRHGLQFARNAQFLLESNLPPIEPERLLEVYTNQAAVRGIPMATKTIRIASLVTGLRTYYADFEHFEHRNRLLSSVATPLQWVHTVFRRPGVAVHPICHLLLIDFLFDSMEAWREALSSEARPSPVPSIPADAHPVRATPIDSAQLRNVSMSCRQVATQFGCSVNTVAAQRRDMGVAISERRSLVVREATPAILDALQKGIALEKVAGDASVSLATVCRVLRSNPDVQQTRSAALTNQLQTQYRKTWSDLMATGLQRGAARKLNPAAYAWLYRNDRDWLVACNPTSLPSTARVSVRSRVDWGQRDQDLSERARQLTHACHPPPGVRPVLRQLGCERMVELHWTRLPRLMDALKTAETPLEARRRRLREAFDRLKTLDRPVTLSALEREARINRSFRPFVIEWIVNEITPEDGLLVACSLRPIQNVT